MFDYVGQEPELERFTCALSIATFRYVPPDVTPGTPEGEEYLNHLNSELCERLQTGGEAFVSNAVLGGKFALRACIVNFRTSEEDVRALPATVVRAGRALHREIQGR
jgi:glutamate/tyrosine decarboxylase-like PLP-dependent enzyme